MKYKLAALFLSCIFILPSCKDYSVTKDKLPYLGIGAEDGEKPVIPPFQFINQLGDSLTEKNIDGKLVVTCFFFTSCPTICPKVTANMLKVYREFEDDQQVMFLSHSIDTRHDSVPILKQYADKLNIDDKKWNFVTGKKDDLFDLSKHYLSIVLEDPDVPGGFDHSGYIILLDGERHIRAYCDGTKAEAIPTFIEQVKVLRDESSSNTH